MIRTHEWKYVRRYAYRSRAHTDRSGPPREAMAARMSVAWILWHAQAPPHHHHHHQ